MAAGLEQGELAMDPALHAGCAAMWLQLVEQGSLAVSHAEGI